MPTSNDRYTFFGSIFKIADAYISIGVFLIILFYKRFFPEEEEEVEIKVKNLY